MRNLDELILSAKVECDDFTKKASEAFDLEFRGESVFRVQTFTPPEDYQIGLIVGPSGSGKTSLLTKIFNHKHSSFTWDKSKAIVSHFETPEDAIERLQSVGLNSIPSWMKPFHVLSNGEKFRAEIAVNLKSGSVFDEFTSVVDRNSAKGACIAIQRYIRKNNIRKTVFCTCHYDVAEWLQPDWVYDTKSGKLLARGCLQPRPKITLEVLPCVRSIWNIFKQHHYLTQSLLTSARCWMCLWGDSLVGFSSSITNPCGTVKKAYREHRTVVLPDFQGFGIGVRLSDAIAKIHKDQGYRYFSKTAHPRMGGYRDSSPLWRPTSKNRKIRFDKCEATRWVVRQGMVTWSHEYIGGE